MAKKLKDKVISSLFYIIYQLISGAIRFLLSGNEYIDRQLDFLWKID